MKGNGGVESREFERLIAVMAALAQGDRAALFQLYEEFGEHVAAVVRRELRRVHAQVPADDFGGLVIDSVMTIADCAAGWDPTGGAMPWVWARHRVRQVVSRHLGQFADSIDAGRKTTTEKLEQYAATVPIAAHDSGVSELEALVRLSATEDVCALLLAALEDVTTERDREILLAYKLQAALGDPSPANTVGDAFRLKPATVRQVVKRSLDRLRKLADTEPRFRALADLHFLSGGVPSPRPA